MPETKQLEEMEMLVYKIRAGMVTPHDVDRFQWLARKAYPVEREFNDFLRWHGYVDMKAFLDDYHNKKNKDFIDGLVKIGLGILAAYGVRRLVKNKRS